MKELGMAKFRQFFPHILARSAGHTASLWHFSSLIRTGSIHNPYGKTAKKKTAKETLCCGFNQSGKVFFYLMKFFLTRVFIQGLGY
jgi:hypothetical protein